MRGIIQVLQCSFLFNHCIESHPPALDKMNFLFELCSKDVFKGKKWKTVDFLFRCSFWERHKSLWELKARLGWPGTGGGGGQVPPAGPLSTESACGWTPSGFWEDAGSRFRGSAGGGSSEQPLASLWPLCEGALTMGHGISSAAGVRAGRWKGSPRDTQQGPRRHLPENLRANKRLYNTVTIHTLQCLECVRKNLQDVGDGMLKLSPANVQWLITISIREKALILPRLSLLINFPLSFSIFGVWKQALAPNASLLCDQHTQSMGNLATRVIDFRKQNNRKDNKRWLTFALRLADCDGY